MKFIDQVTIRVFAGNGGPGSKHFRREKFVPYGGPDGGNGGNGGSVIFEADENKHTLLDFKFHPEWKAEHGKPGGKSLSDGPSGGDLIIPVPVGTEILDSASEELLADLTRQKQRFIAAHGGKGGKGNAFFKSATNQAPEYVQPGLPGESGEFILSLKLLADVGLVGLPNAGKSTLISRISAAKPKIADYPFTTITPNLGVVQGKGKTSFVVADVPGLIPGAHEGKGLGTHFLKHLERTKLLVHLVDVLPPAYQDEVPNNDWNPLDDVLTINQELELFSPTLAKAPQLIVFSKIDSLPDKSVLENYKQKAGEIGYDSLAISSATNEGIEQLIDYLTERVYR
ncbi:MAG: GTPase ObgE [Bdellovibrionales bacterium]|nr:GTPase ObgE [Bdellovibrionales bacterium]